MKPNREPATRNQQTYFVTAKTWEQRPFFRHERWAELFLAVLYHYRGPEYLVHEFVLMPDHFHILLTPVQALERTVQLIKGGFSRRASVDMESNMTIWQRGFSDHRIRDAADYLAHKEYIDRNPVKATLSDRIGGYRYCSASGASDLDPCPQGLKPVASLDGGGTAEAVPFQRSTIQRRG